MHEEGRGHVINLTKRKHLRTGSKQGKEKKKTRNNELLQL